jgi:hypothetical protein
VLLGAVAGFQKLKRPRRLAVFDVAPPLLLQSYQYKYDPIAETQRVNISQLD